MPKLRIGLLLFPRMTQLDLTGPFEVFTRLPDAQVLLLWKTLEPVEADSGLRLLPYATLRDCPPPPCANANPLRTTGIAN